MDKLRVRLIETHVDDDFCHQHQQSKAIITLLDIIVTIITVIKNITLDIVFAVETFS